MKIKLGNRIKDKIYNVQPSLTNNPRELKLCYPIILSDIIQLNREMYGNVGLIASKIVIRSLGIIVHTLITNFNDFLNKKQEQQ